MNEVSPYHVLSQAFPYYVELSPQQVAHAVEILVDLNPHEWGTSFAVTAREVESTGNMRRLWLSHASADLMHDYLDGRGRTLIPSRGE